MLTPCVLLLLLPQVAAAQADKDDPLTPKILVQAKAIKACYSNLGGQQPDGTEEVTFRIEHVYAGEAKLKGQTFHSVFPVVWEIGGAGVSILSQRIKVGEVGIFGLTYDEDGKLTHERNVYAAKDIESAEGLGFPTFARKIIPAHDYYVSYALALKWAEVVETVYKAKPEDRPQLLRRHLASDNLYVAAWSAQMLAQYAPADLIPYLKKRLAEPRLSLGAQLTIDLILASKDRDKWPSSKQRQALLQHWVSGDITDPREVRIIVSHIEHSLSQGHLDWETWLPLMEKWVIEHRLDETLEGELYSLLRTTSHDNPSSPKFIACRGLILRRAFDLLKSSKDQNTQIYAAKWLGEINDLSVKERALVKDLKEKSKDEYVRALLAAAIRDSTPKPRRP